MKLKEKDVAIKLRQCGKSYGEILKEINVSKGTLSLWLRDIKLTEQQYDRIYTTLRLKSAYKGAKFLQEKKNEKILEILNNAKKDVDEIIKNPLFLAGLMLYWAEGDKSERSETVKFSNSDPKMILLMMRWFRNFCDVPEKKFRICLHIHRLHCRKNIKRYWSELTRIPISQFFKTQIKPTSLRHRRNKLYNGTCAIIIYNRDLFRKIKGWKLAFLAKIDIK